MLSNIHNYGDHSWVCSSSIWERVCFKLRISHEHLQYSRWEPCGFFEVGTTAFLCEVPADSVVLSKARGENWPLVLLMVWLIDVLLFSPGGTVWSPAAPPAPPGCGRMWLCSFPVHCFCQPCNSWSSLLPLNVGNCSGSLLGQSVPPLCTVIAKQLRMSGSQ